MVNISNLFSRYNSIKQGMSNQYTGQITQPAQMPYQSIKPLADRFSKITGKVLMPIQTTQSTSQIDTSNFGKSKSMTFPLTPQGQSFVKQNIAEHPVDTSKTDNPFSRLGESIAIHKQKKTGNITPENLAYEKELTKKIGQDVMSAEMTGTLSKVGGLSKKGLSQIDDLTKLAQRYKAEGNGLNKFLIDNSPLNTDILYNDKKELLNFINKSKTFDDWDSISDELNLLGIEERNLNKVKDILESDVKTTENLIKEQKRLTDIYNKANQSVDTFERASNLSPQERIIENKAFDKIKSQESKILEDNISINGKIVNADNFKNVFQDVGYVGHNAAAVQEPSSYLAKKAFEKSLKENNGRFGTLYAGGSGTGKTSAINNIEKLKPIIDNSSVILDGNLSTYNSAVKKINQIKENGRVPYIVYTYRDIVDSFVNGVVKRSLNNPKEKGRIVPISIIVDNHIGSWETVKELYKNKIRTAFLDNSLGKGNQKLLTFDEINNKINYASRDTLIKQLKSEAKNLLDTGMISPEQYKAYIK